MANRDNPHGFRPLMRSVTGGPGAAAMPAHKLVGYGTALFINDVVTRVASGTKPTQAISAAITPGTTVIAGVNLIYGAASTATDHIIIPAPFQVFEAQIDTAAAADLNKNAAIVLTAGNTGTKISKHSLNGIATTNTLDCHVVGIQRSPDNDFGAFARLEIIFNRCQLTDQAVGI